MQRKEKGFSRILQGKERERKKNLKGNIMNENF